MRRIMNCLIVDDELIAREILETHLQKMEDVRIIASCKNVMEAFNEINNHKIDVIFLDINMPEITGLSFAKTINSNIKVIFTTAYRDYAVDGFNLQAVDYLLKPISFDRLRQAVEKYFEENKSQTVIENTKEASKKNDFIFVRSDRKMIKVNFSKIIYVESLSDYIKIHFDDKYIITRETITSIESKLPKNDFLRIHRSYIISISKITSFTNEFVELNNKALSISRSYKKDVLHRLENV